MKSLYAMAACALALGFAATAPATAAPLSKAPGTTLDTSSLVQSVHDRRGRWHKHHWKRRHCWRSCTGIGPLRVCKRKCRY